MAQGLIKGIIGLDEVKLDVVQIVKHHFHYNYPYVQNMLSNIPMYKC